MTTFLYLQSDPALLNSMLSYRCVNTSNSYTKPSFFVYNVNFIFLDISSMYLFIVTHTPKKCASSATRNIQNM
jgi:hypothetical protein